MRGDGSEEVMRKCQCCMLFARYARAQACMISVFTAYGRRSQTHIRNKMRRVARPKRCNSLRSRVARQFDSVRAQDFDGHTLIGTMFTRRYTTHGGDARCRLYVYTTMKVRV